MQSKARQGALACGLVLMLAATVLAVPMAAIKKHRSLEPSVHDSDGGMGVDEASQDLERANCEDVAPGGSCINADSTSGTACAHWFEFRQGFPVVCQAQEGLCIATQTDLPKSSCPARDTDNIYYFKRYCKRYTEGHDMYEVDAGFKCSDLDKFKKQHCRQGILEEVVPLHHISAAEGVGDRRW